jgi:Bacterial SH3 domain
VHNSTAYPFFLGLAAGIGLTLAGLVLPGVITAWIVPPQPSPVHASLDSAAPSRPLSGAAAPTQTPNSAPTTAPPGPTVLPTLAATPAPQAEIEHATVDSKPGDRMRIAHTDGQGVALRSAPDDAARQPAGFLEGQQVTVIERVGGDWVRVRGDSGLEGWVPSAFLQPHPCDEPPPATCSAPN